MNVVLLLTGPEVVAVVRDVVLIVFLVFAFFALVVLVVINLLEYRRRARMIEVITAAAERGDRVLEDIGEITDRVRAGSTLPGTAIRGVLGIVPAVLSGLFRGRRRPERRRRRQRRD